MTTEIDWTKPLRIVNGPYGGCRARVICTDRKFDHDPDFTHVILIATEAHGEILAACMTDGQLYRASYLKDRVENWEGVQ